MRILILGVGDAFSRLHYGSSALIEGPSGLVLIDCPDPIHRVLNDASVASGWRFNPADIHDIIITHLHGDHCNGLESFGFARWVERLRGGATPIPRVHCWKPVADRLWERLAPAMDLSDATGPKATLSTYFDLNLLDPNSSARIAGLSVRCRPTQHPIPTVGLLLSEGGSTFGWSADTPFERAHVDWLSQADLFAHECNEPPAHTGLDELEKLPPAIKSRMRLVHLPDDSDQARVSIQVLREGEVLCL